jgi:hypothetical protein
MENSGPVPDVVGPHAHPVPDVVLTCAPTPLPFCETKSAHGDVMLVRSPDHTNPVTTSKLAPETVRVQDTGAALLTTDLHAPLLAPVSIPTLPVDELPSNMQKLNAPVELLSVIAKLVSPPVAEST